jgi:hypothetical protein
MNNVRCYYISPAVDEIVDTLSDTGEAKDYDKATGALNAYFIPHVNTAFEEYNFRQAKQNQSETLDAFHTRLRSYHKIARLQMSIKR